MKVNERFISDHREMRVGHLFVIHVIHPVFSQSTLEHVSSSVVKDAVDKIYTLSYFLTSL